MTAAYSTELANLMDHEKVIEQGLGTFIDVGNALLAIREDKMYKHAAGNYATFEAYCRGRWDISDSRARQLIGAVKTVTAVTVGDVPIPTSEGQIRPLVPLRDKPEVAAEAWAEAAKEASDDGREQPTAKEVERAVAKRQPPKREHPAPFSDTILERVADRVRGASTVLDPFAGTGRVHELRELAGVDKTIGVEIEPEWAAKHPDTMQGDALDLDLEDESVDAIATSPTYGNRMADTFDAKDDSVRNTYKHTLGHDLNENNSGGMQWGDEYRAFHLKAWAEAERVLRDGGTFVVNVKDHIRDGVEQDVVAWHIDTLYGLGLHLIGLDLIPTRGLAVGDNAATRVCAEVVLTFRKETPPPHACAECGAEWWDR